MGRTIRAAAAALVIGSASGTLAAKAADLSLPPVYEPEASPIVELGTGWYLRADANVYDASYRSDIFGTLSDTNFGATIGAGYQFNSFFRVDATYDYLTPVRKTKTYLLDYPSPVHGLPSTDFAGTLYPPGCPVAADTSVAGNLDYVSCTANPWVKVSANVFLLNAYLDLGHWYAVTPYVGAGAGLAIVHSQANIDYRFVNGVAYGTSGHNNYCGFQGGTGGLPCYHLGYANDAGPSVTNYNFAYALMAGFTYDLSNLVKVDIGYRYLDMGSKTNAQQFRAGVRITPDG